MDREEFSAFNEPFLGMELAFPWIGVDTVGETHGRELVMAAYVVRGELDAPDDLGDGTWRDLVFERESLNDHMDQGEARVEYWLGELAGGLSGDELLQEMLYRAARGDEGLSEDPANIEFRREIAESLHERLDDIETDDPESLLEASREARVEAARSEAVSDAAPTYTVQEVVDDVPASDEWWWGIIDSASELARVHDDNDVDPEDLQSANWAQLKGPVDVDRLDLTEVSEQGVGVRFEDDSVSFGGQSNTLAVTVDQHNQLVSAEDAGQATIELEKAVDTNDGDRAAVAGVGTYTLDTSVSNTFAAADTGQVINLGDQGDTLTVGSGVDTIHGGDSEDTVIVSEAGDANEDDIDGGDNTGATLVFQDGNEDDNGLGGTLASIEEVKLESETGVDLSEVDDGGFDVSSQIDGDANTVVVSEGADDIDLSDDAEDTVIVSAPGDANEGEIDGGGNDGAVLDVRRGSEDANELSTDDLSSISAVKLDDDDVGVTFETNDPFGEASDFEPNDGTLAFTGDGDVSVGTEGGLKLGDGELDAQQLEAELDLGADRGDDEDATAGLLLGGSGGNDGQHEVHLADGGDGDGEYAINLTETEGNNIDVGAVGDVDGYEEAPVVVRGFEAGDELSDVLVNFDAAFSGGLDGDQFHEEANQEDDPVEVEDGGSYLLQEVDGDLGDIAFDDIFEDEGDYLDTDDLDGGEAFTFFVHAAGNDHIGMYDVPDVSDGGFGEDDVELVGVLNGPGEEFDSESLSNPSAVFTAGEGFDTRAQEGETESQGGDDVSAFHDDDLLVIREANHIDEDSVLDGVGGSNTLMFGEGDEDVDIRQLDRLADVDTIDLTGEDPGSFSDEPQNVDFEELDEFDSQLTGEASQFDELELRGGGEDVEILVTLQESPAADLSAIEPEPDGAVTLELNEDAAATRGFRLADRDYGISGQGTLDVTSARAAHLDTEEVAVGEDTALMATAEQLDAGEDRIASVSGEGHVTAVNLDDSDADLTEVDPGAGDVTLDLSRDLGSSAAVGAGFELAGRDYTVDGGELDVTESAGVGEITEFGVEDGSELTLRDVQGAGLEVHGDGEAVVELDEADVDLSTVTPAGGVSLALGEGENVEAGDGLEFTNNQSYAVTGGTAEDPSTLDVTGADNLGWGDRTEVTVGEHSTLRAREEQLEGVDVLGPGDVEHPDPAPFELTQALEPPQETVTLGEDAAVTFTASFENVGEGQGDLEDLELEVDGEAFEPEEPLTGIAPEDGEQEAEFRVEVEAITDGPIQEALDFDVELRGDFENPAGLATEAELTVEPDPDAPAYVGVEADDPVEWAEAGELTLARLARFADAAVFDEDLRGTLEGRGVSVPEADDVQGVLDGAVALAEPMITGADGWEVAQDEGHGGYTMESVSRSLEDLQEHDEAAVNWLQFEYGVEPGTLVDAVNDLETRGEDFAFVEQAVEGAVGQVFEELDRVIDIDAARDYVLGQADDDSDLVDRLNDEVPDLIGPVFSEGDFGPPEELDDDALESIEELGGRLLAEDDEELVDPDYVIANVDPFLENVDRILRGVDEQDWDGFSEIEEAIEERASRDVGEGLGQLQEQWQEALAQVQGEAFESVTDLAGELAEQVREIDLIGPFTPEEPLSSIIDGA